jgi:hypothetical protein
MIWLMNKTQYKLDTHFVRCVDLANVKGNFMFGLFYGCFKSN